MEAKYLHIGIPIKEKRGEMIHLEHLNVWASNVDDYDFKIEYLVFEEGNPFPELIQTTPHVAYAVADMQPYFAQAEKVLFGPRDLAPGLEFAYILMDNAIIELQAPKKA